MMTKTERMARINSLNNMRSALSAVRSKTVDAELKLHAFKNWFEPTGQIRTSVDARIAKLSNDFDAAHALCEKLDKEVEKLYALPYITTPDIWDGAVGTIIISGWLPDCTPSSEDEKEALTMLEDYYAKTRELSA